MNSFRMVVEWADAVPGLAASVTEPRGIDWCDGKGNATKEMVIAEHCYEVDAMGQAASTAIFFQSGEL